MEEIFLKGGPLAVAAGFVLYVILSGRVVTKGHHDEVVQQKDAQLDAERRAKADLGADRDWWRTLAGDLMPTTRDAIRIAERRRHVHAEGERQEQAQ